MSNTGVINNSNYVVVLFKCARFRAQELSIAYWHTLWNRATIISITYTCVIPAVISENVRKIHLLVEKAHKHPEVSISSTVCVKVVASFAAKNINGKEPGGYFYYSSCKILGLV